jgi:mRNA-degrading endonuclease HigB of HigAB toxin-antitoxin module
MSAQSFLDPAVGQYAGPHVWLVLNRRRLCISPISHHWNLPWACVMMVRLGDRMAPSHGAEKAHPKASILKGGRVVFNIKANDYHLIAVVRYENGVMMIRFFGSHEEYDQVDA